jgi:RND family efflux transporter MFP subunit
MSVIICATLLVSACERKQPPKSSWVPVRSHKVEALGGAGGVRYSANVTPKAQVNLAFKVDGFVETITKVEGVDKNKRELDQGDYINKGTLLARIRDTEYSDNVKKAQANLAKANASLDKATQDYRRAKNLYATQSITGPDYDSAKQEYETAIASVAGAKAQLNEAQLKLSYCSLIAPMDGVLLSRKIEVGTLVNTQTVAFVQADMTSVKVEFGVPDVMLDTVKLGNTLHIRTGSIPEKTFSGVVTAVAASADSKTRVFEIEITIANPTGELKDGMVASLEVPKEMLAYVHAVLPLSAIVRAPGNPDQYAVYVIEDKEGKQIAHSRPVQLGDVIGNTISVTGGVKVGEQVVVSGTAMIKDGDIVRAVP